MSQAMRHIGGLIDLNKYQQAQARAAEHPSPVPTPVSGMGRPGCPICTVEGVAQGVHKVETPTGTYGVGHWRYDVVPCECKTRVVSPERQARLDRWSTLEENYRGCTFATTEERPGQEAALCHARAFADDPRGWLVLMGGTGRGKSRVAACVAWQLYHSSKGVLWISASDLLQHLRDSYNHAAGVATSEILDVIRSAPHLFIDDLGPETPTAWVRDTMRALIDKRWMRQLPTVITTNVSLSKMAGPDASRLASKSRLVYVGGADQRTGLEDHTSGLTTYHYLEGQPFLCASCGSHPCIPSCPVQRRAPVPQGPPEDVGF